MKKEIVLSIKDRAKVLLLKTRQAPTMFAITKDSLMSRVFTILDMVEVNYDVVDFYKLHLKTMGSAYATASEVVNVEWAHQLIDHALEMINETA